MTKTGGIQLSPEMVEGPFYAKGGSRRSDIREGQAGQNLNLTITIIDVASGNPLPGIDIDFWQCNATGHYSGYDVDPDELPENISNGQQPTNDDTFLRGRQTSDAAGQVHFQTIYPGWYTLRTPHIHLKIFEGDNCNTTTQLYLPENINQDLYATPDYVRIAEQDTFNRTDPVIASAQGDIASLWVEVNTDADVFSGSATLAIMPGNINDLIIVPPGRIPPKGGRAHDKPTK